MANLGLPRIPFTRHFLSAYVCDTLHLLLVHLAVTAGEELQL